jgi:hypothetical protein
VTPCACAPKGLAAERGCCRCNGNVRRVRFGNGVVCCVLRVTRAQVRSSLATLDEFDLEMVPLDEDLISLELPDCFRECYLDKNRESLYYIAKAIMKLQIMFGIFPHIRGKGHCSKVVCDMLVRMRKEMRIDDLRVPPEVDALVLLDRDLDLVSPLLTQMTYEGEYN